MAELKTFLFTDIVGSVDLKRQMPGRSDGERDQAFIELVLRPHRQRIEQGLAAHGGRVVSTAGDGHFLVFSDTSLAARWAIEMQERHRDAPIRTPRGNAVEVRSSMHLGIPQIDPHDPDNFVGKPVDYAARLSDYATGGQILASRSVVAVLEDAGMDGVTFHRHGSHELKGIGRVEVYELVYDRAGPHSMRAAPGEAARREWTVLPATMGLTEFYGGDVEGGTGGASGTLGGGQRGAGQKSHELGGWGRASGEAANSRHRGLADARAQPPTDVVPLRVGNYELEDRLGSGGMGDVYRARHTQFDRVRAVKIIKQHFVDSGQREVIRRFYQEIKAVGALEHPNIVVAIDSSAPTDSIHYLVMEFIDGMGADEVVGRQGPLGVAEACEIARQAARGLAYIHQNGMVHRDIKPSNLMLTVVRTDELGAGSSVADESGEEQAVVKILDLGLALLVGDHEQRLTLFDHRAMGTAMYMSPEQWRTTTVDIRADIYSLGCTLYHLLSGQPPFWESDLRPEKAHEREPLPAIRRQSVPQPLWDVLVKMTAKDPADRYAEPAEVVAALAPLAEGHRLSRLVKEASRGGPGAATHGFAKTETRIGKNAESDTRLARTPANWGRPDVLSRERPQRKVRQVASAAILLAAVAAIGWLAIQATERQRSAEEARTKRAELLTLSADYATSEILREINIRFAILNQLAHDAQLQQRMTEIDHASGPQRESLWGPLDEWLGAKKSDYDSRAPAESWFINDRAGRQIARSPRSDRSTGESYAYRDYFHGQGADLPEGATDIEPIASQHLSAVYQSTTTGHLKVAFSVPIENGRTGDARQVVGVLAMAVDLGEFNVLRTKLPEECEVVLVDLRRETIEGETRRGLVLHHHGREAFRRGQPTPWIGDELLAQIDQALGASYSPDSVVMLDRYSDPVVSGGRAYRGALKPVVDQRPDRELGDTGWLVLVQEPLSK
jgi:serine/threonine protein kinase/class 3 adenylate cyclase